MVAEGKKRTVLRFEIAIDSLCHILRRLESEDGRYLVGLRVYGHRAGWTAIDKKPIPVVWDPNHPGTRYDTGQTIVRPRDYSGPDPNKDIEEIRPLVSFGRSDTDMIQKTLDRLRPLGETPLYLAIEQAIKDLNSRHRAPQAPGVSPPQRHIVVITDGVEDTSDNQGSRQLISDIGDLRDKLLKEGDNKDIRLDIVGFDLDADAQVRNIDNPIDREEFP